MAAIRISPGIYEVNGKRVTATSAAEAVRKAGGARPQPRNPAAGNPGDPRIIPRRTKIRGVSDAIEASEDVADVEARKGLRYGNVSKQTGALGDSREIYYDENGQPIEMRDTLSAGQQGISDADTGISQAGRSAALNQLGGGRFGQGYNAQTNRRTVGQDLFGADRQRIEDAVFGNLTRNLGRDKERDRQAEEAVLAERGIAIDPRDEQYAKATADRNERYDAIEANARDRATQIGGQELTNAFGMQEQGIANQFSQGWQGRQNNLAEVQALSNLGPGLRTGNFQGFQGVGYDIADPVATDLSYKANTRENRALGRLGGGGGGSQGPAQPPQPESPFNANQPSGPGPQMAASAPLAPQPGPTPSPAPQAGNAALQQLGTPRAAPAPAAAPRPAAQPAARAVRVSPGVYTVNGRRVNAVSEADALRKAGVR